MMTIKHLAYYLLYKFKWSRSVFIIIIKLFPSQVKGKRQNELDSIPHFTTDQLRGLRQVY